MVAAIRLWTVSVFVSLLMQTYALDATLQRFKESPGLHYDHVGEAQLYNTEWRIVTYINLHEADRNLKIVYAQLSADFCYSHAHTKWINSQIA
jgi:hypothetical protein